MEMDEIFILFFPIFSPITSYILLKYFTVKVDEYTFFCMQD